MKGDQGKEHPRVENAGCDATVCSASVVGGDPERPVVLVETIGSTLLSTEKDDVDGSSILSSIESESGRVESRDSGSLTEGER